MFSQYQWYFITTIIFLATACCRIHALPSDVAYLDRSVMSGITGLHVHRSSTPGDENILYVPSGPVGLRIVDISNYTHPRILTKISTADGLPDARDVRVVDDATTGHRYAFICTAYAAQDKRGLYIYDITGITPPPSASASPSPLPSPILLSSHIFESCHLEVDWQTTTTTTTTTTTEGGEQQLRRYVYLSGSRKLQIIDIHNLTQPIVISTLSNQKITSSGRMTLSYSSSSPPLVHLWSPDNNAAVQWYDVTHVTHPRHMLPPSEQDWWGNSKGVVVDLPYIYTCNHKGIQIWRWLNDDMSTTWPTLVTYLSKSLYSGCISIAFDSATSTLWIGERGGGRIISYDMHDPTLPAVSDIHTSHGFTEHIVLLPSSSTSTRPPLIAIANTFTFRPDDSSAYGLRLLDATSTSSTQRRRPASLAAIHRTTRGTLGVTIVRDDGSGSGDGSGSTRTLAFVYGSGFVHIVDCTQPLQPRLVGSIVVQLEVRNLVVVDDYVYITLRSGYTNTNSQVQVWWLGSNRDGILLRNDATTTTTTATPATPASRIRLLSAYELCGTPLALEVYDAFLYVATMRSGQGTRCGFTILSIQPRTTEPYTMSAMVFVSTTVPHYDMAIQKLPVTTTTTSTTSTTTTVNNNVLGHGGTGTYVYVTAGAYLYVYNATGLQEGGITAASQVRELAKVQQTDTGIRCVGVAIDDQRQLLYVSRELDGLAAFDIRSPATPVVVWQRTWAELLLGDVDGDGDDAARHVRLHQLGSGVRLHYDAAASLLSVAYDVGGILQFLITDTTTTTTTSSSSSTTTGTSPVTVSLHQHLQLPSQTKDVWHGPPAAVGGGGGGQTTGGEDQSITIAALIDVGLYIMIGQESQQVVATTPLQLPMCNATHTRRCQSITDPEQCKYIANTNGWSCSWCQLFGGGDGRTTSTSTSTTTTTAMSAPACYYAPPPQSVLSSPEGASTPLTSSLSPNCWQTIDNIKFDMDVAQCRVPDSVPIMFTPTPLPTPTPTPTPTPLPATTATPTPETQSPTPIPTPTPQQSPTPIPTPTPQQSPTPTPTPQQSPSPTPTPIKETNSGSPGASLLRQRRLLLSSSLPASSTLTAVVSIVLVAMLLMM